MDTHDQESRITADRWEIFEMHQLKQLKTIHSKRSMSLYRLHAESTPSPEEVAILRQAIKPRY